jgi:hypothetical protein
VSDPVGKGGEVSGVIAYPAVRGGTTGRTFLITFKGELYWTNRHVGGNSVSPGSGWFVERTFYWRP